MGCERIHLGAGFTATVCTRGQRRRRCKRCKNRWATKLCDYPTPTRKSPAKTCDYPLCEECAIRKADRIPLPGTVVGDSVDLCSLHETIVGRYGWPRGHEPPKAEKSESRAPMQQKLFEDP